jgi:ATP-binding cassette subfamily F protein 3
MKKLSFVINPNEKIGIIGQNGIGKTTLLRLLAQSLSPTAGTIKYNVNTHFGYFGQSNIERLDNEKNIIESLCAEGIGEQEARNIAGNLLFSGDLAYKKIKNLSGGEKARVNLGCIFTKVVNLLFLDEPTNHLDINGIIFLEKFCNNWKKAILSISHDIRFINNTSNKIAEISNKKINNYPGNYEKYLIEKQIRFDTQMKNYTNQKKEIEKEMDYINRFRANSAKATSVQSRIKALAKVEILSKPENESVVKMISINTDKRLPEIIMKLEKIEV